LEKGPIRKGKIRATIRPSNHSALNRDLVAFIGGARGGSGLVDDLNRSDGIDDDGDAGLAVGGGAFFGLAGIGVLGEGSRDAQRCKEKSYE
jgi:predicted acylesterase/phospholipase RssA